MNLCVSVSAHFGGRLGMPALPSPHPPCTHQEGDENEFLKHVTEKEDRDGNGGSSGSSIV